MNNGKNNVIEMRTRQISLKTFLNDHEEVFNTIKEFESLHKYCHGKDPSRRGLISPHATPQMCEYLIKFEEGYDKEVITMNCAIHEDDYIPTVFVLFLFDKKPNNELLNRFGYMFTEHMIHAFMDKGPSMMDLKHYVESHISRDDRVPFIDYYYYLKQKYYGGKQ